MPTRRRGSQDCPTCEGGDGSANRQGSDPVGWHAVSVDVCEELMVRRMIAKMGGPVVEAVCVIGRRAYIAPQVCPTGKLSCGARRETQNVKRERDRAPATDRPWRRGLEQHGSCFTDHESSPTPLRLASSRLTPRRRPPTSGREQRRGPPAGCPERWPAPAGRG